MSVPNTAFTATTASDAPTLNPNADTDAGSVTACQKALSDKRHLSDILREDMRVGAHITVGELARLFELMGYQGAAQTLIDRQIGSLQGGRPAKRS